MLTCRYMILGVAFGWGERKGLDVFIALSKFLDERFKIVLVGTNKQMDEMLPDSIVSIHKTQNQKQLAKIYSAADIFVNPTREDNFPTVNLESLACGTPVITFRTGGSMEMLDDSCGKVAENREIEALAREITGICENKVYHRSDCVQRAEMFRQEKRLKEYLQLYSQESVD